MVASDDDVTDIRISTQPHEGGSAEVSFTLCAGFVLVVSAEIDGVWYPAHAFPREVTATWRRGIEREMAS